MPLMASLASASPGSAVLARWGPSEGPTRRKRVRR